MSQPSIKSGSEEQGNFTLSQADVERLLTEDSAESRIDIVDKITTQYHSGYFNAREYDYAEQIFRLLMKDAEWRVRRALSSGLASDPQVPRDILMHLAEDIEQVSVPILRASQVLSDADLIHIIETTREVGKLVAISTRDRLSRRVSHALVETNYPEVILALLANDGATIGETDLEQMVEQFSDEESITAAMVRRGGLPVAVAEKLIRHVSGAMAEELRRRYKLPDMVFEQAAREQLTLDIITPDTPEDDIHTLIDQLIAADRFGPTFVLGALCRGNLRFFEVALARLANIPAANAHKLIHDKGQLGFSALYRKTGLPESMLEAVRLLLQVVLSMDPDARRKNPGLFANQVVQGILAQSAGRDIGHLTHIIALVRQAVNN